ncbi:5'-nucleotidase, lipoprotein e(P4) family [Zunongwangia sp. F363]|uniref:5'-nucleotidase, lipoprotein e(P4) family n=1 Tax=Autumnicola tepida TaxID=3075595 RepID=A0ABU3CB02_9FLAO|nr:5'-nucleotidase, lipoprotein e(P4) family [Zunongwangia sp. F363]MDT0643522.1 5'-nucleotidase, lipoprotein e(P4) family [Zunongwangia sp. F363]
MYDASRLRIFAITFFCISVFSCKPGQETAATPVNIDPGYNQLSEQLVMSTLWFQNSLEARQLYIQTYELAKIKLLANNDKSVGGKPNAVVLDIDETVLDNSAYEARLIEKGENYASESWANWVNEENAPALPGAVDFINFAQENNVSVFLVSNRNVETLDATFNNLEKVGIQVEEDHVLLKKDTSNKDARREKISENYEVILYVGDQLTDFASIFDTPSEAEKLLNRENDSLQKVLNQKFIILPNPMYGTFEQAVYPEGDLNNQQKSEARKKALNTAGL